MKTIRYYLSLYRLYRPGYGRIGAGRIEDVAAYCRGDVAATREVWRHMTFSTAHALRGELEAA